MTRNRNNKSDSSMSSPNSSFSTGIKNPILTNPLQPAVSVTSSQPGIEHYRWCPTYTSGYILNPAGTQDPSNGNQSISAIVFDQLIPATYSNYLQAKVNFNISFDQDDLGLAMEYLCGAISLYYTTESVLKLTANTAEQNIGTDKMRDKITAEILQRHDELKRRLEGLSIPPNMLKLTHYLYQPFKFSNLPGAPICKFTYSGTFTYANDDPVTDLSIKLSPELYENVLSALNSKQSIYSLITRMKPNWQIKNMPEAWDVPKVDKGLQSIWLNSSVYAAQSTSDQEYRYPLANTLDDSTFVYVLTDNELDGAIYALSCIAAPGSMIGNANRLYQPGFFTPWDTNDRKSTTNWYCNRSLYYNGEGPAVYGDGGSAGWIWDYDFTVTIGSTTGIPRTGGAPGTQLAQLNSVNNMKSSVTDLMTWMWNLNDLKDLSKRS